MKTVGEAIDETMKSLEAAEAEAVNEPEADEPEIEPEADEPEIEPSEDGAEELTAEAVNEGEEPEEIMEPEAVVDVPASWAKEGRDVWGKLTPEAQRYISEREKQREADYTRKTQEISQARKRYEALEASIEDVRPLFESAGVDPIVGQQQLNGLAKYAAQNPREYARWFLQQSGIDPLDLLDDDSGQPSQVAPEVAAMQAELNQLRGIVGQFEQSQQTQRQQTLQQHIEQFAGAKDASGNPLYPHFESVRERMAGLLNGGLATDLKEAYEQAIRLDPSISEQLRASEAKAKAVKAKKAAGRDVRTAGADAVPAKKQSNTDWRETLKQAADRAYS